MFVVAAGCYFNKKQGGKAPGTDEKTLRMIRVMTLAVVLDLIAGLAILAPGIYGIATQGQCAVSLMQARVCLSIGSFYTTMALIFTTWALFKKVPAMGNRSWCHAACTGKVS